MEFRDWLLSEMPINKFQLMGKWGDQDKLYHYDQPSVGILTSEKGVAQIHRRWSNTKQNFNLYFLRGPNVWKQVEVGKVTPEWVEEKLGYMIEPDEFAISIIFTQNRAAERTPLTAWTIAHRLGHAITRDSTFEHYFENEIKQRIKSLLKEVFNIQDSTYADEITRKKYGLAERALFEAIGTMRSARTGQLKRPREYLFELVAQYINTGQIKFNAVPQHLNLRQRMGWLRANPQNLSKWNNYMDDWAEQLTYNLDTVFSGLVGEIFVM